MSEINQPILSSKTILKATIIAFIIALVLVFTAVLPAEYGVDPTGAGNLLGFSKLYQGEEAKASPGADLKVKILKLEDGGSGPEVVRPAELNNPAPAVQYEEREDEVSITVPAGKGLEYKVNVLKYGKLKYEWITDSGPVFFDFHGELNENSATKSNYYESHTAAYSNNMIGTFVSPFEGKHGWYFKNNGTIEKVIKVRLKGQYQLRPND